MSGVQGPPRVNDDLVSITAILHARRWPERSHVERQIAALRDAFGDRVTVVEATERSDDAKGAAAVVNAAAARAAGDLLLVMEPGVAWPADTLRAIAERATRCRLAIAPMNLWAIERTYFNDLGGLDERLWSVGYVEDLAARAALHRDPAFIDVRGEPIGPESYPLPDDVKAFLALRNDAITAFKTASDDTLGRRLAVVAGRGLIAAARAADLDPAAFAFGAPAASPSPRNATGALLPILALDSFLSELPELWRERRANPPKNNVAAEMPADLLQEIAAATGLATSPVAPTTTSTSQLSSTSQLHEITRRSTSPTHQFTNSPFVSVVIVNWNGREHLEHCFRSLEASTYPADRLELILVDNGSTDGSRELMARLFPRVKVVALDRNLGFTGGNNAGVAAATGDVLVFFNNDMRVDPDAIPALVAAMDGGVACAAARVLSWDGRRIDFVRGSASFEALGFQEHYGLPNSPTFAVATSTFFPNGGAFAVTRAAYERSGGFDDAFFAYYDDLDLGWRLRLTGHGVRVVPNAIVYHRHGATSRRHPKGRKAFLMQRNALWTALKNYGDDTLDRTLAPILLLAARRIAQSSRVTKSSPLARALAPFSARCRPALFAPKHYKADDIYRSSRGDRFVKRLPVESLAAVSAALADLPRIAAARADVQRRRRVADRDVLREMGRPLESASSVSSYVDVQDTLVDALSLKQAIGQPARVLIITHEPMRANLSGPGIRVLEIGRALAAQSVVTIATPCAPEIQDDRCTIAPYTYTNPATLKRLAEQADLLIVQGFTLARFPFLTRLDLPIVVDLYCPFSIEHLEMTRARSDRSAVGVEAAGILEVQNDQLRHGDFFICASGQQRDFWLGTLHTAGRLNPLTYADDPTLRRLIDVVPFGLPAVPIGTMTTGGPALKGRHPNVSARDRVILWGGSLLDWQDPETAIRAIVALGRADVKLFFMGTRHPNPDVPLMRAVEASRRLTSELRLEDRVIFNDWVPYAERARYLVDADIGLSTHQDHLETRFAFRTRMLDYIWAQLPIVCTKGDYFAQLVETRGLGLTVPPGDAAALAAAMARLMDDTRLRADCQENLRSVARELTWDRVVEPLRRFCADPRVAADRAPAARAVRDRLRGSYGVSKAIKRAALRLGVPEDRFERVKQWKVTQAAMILRNRVAHARARRGAR